MNVITEVCDKNRCIGCGVCIGICPVKNLKIDFNKNDYYEVFDKNNCLEKCDLCLKICPFYKKELKENELNLEIFKDLPNYIEDFGKFLQTYEFSKLNLEEKLQSASGGAGDYILTKLLELNLVDKIIAVKSNFDPNKLFKFAVFDDFEELKKARSSAYYPVSMDEICEFILKNDFRYVITALPCFAKALRNLQNINKKAKNRIKFIIGLVCGQQKSKKFTNFLANLNFKEEKTLKKVNFRKKQKDKLASNFAFEFIFADEFKFIDERKKSPAMFWSSRAFTPYACNNCFDIFAKCADVTLMDAWLEDKIKDYSGHSLIISRNKKIDEILKKCDENEVFCKEISPNLVLKSQIAVLKEKRMFYFKSRFNFLKILKVRLKKQIQKSSFEDEKEIFLNLLDKNLKLIKKIDKINKIFLYLKILFTEPKKIKNKIKKMLKC